MSGTWSPFGKQTPPGTRRRPELEPLEARTLLSAAMTATGISPVSMLAGFHYSGLVTTFTAPGVTGYPSNVTVTVNWGDGTPAQTTRDLRPVAGHPGLFQAWAGHTFLRGRATPYTLSVQVRDRNGHQALSTSLFQIYAPVVSFFLPSGTLRVNSPTRFQVHVANTPGNKAPTSYLLEYQAPGDKTWHVLSRAAWNGTANKRGGFDLAGTLRLPKAGHFLVRALATVGPVQYPAPAVSVTVR